MWREFVYSSGEQYAGIRRIGLKESLREPFFPRYVEEFEFWSNGLAVKGQISYTAQT